jgi:hypothetical protein
VLFTITGLKYFLGVQRMIAIATKEEGTGTWKEISK